MPSTPATASSPPSCVTSSAAPADEGRLLGQDRPIWDISTLEKGDAFAAACARLGDKTDLTNLARGSDQRRGRSGSG